MRGRLEGDEEFLMPALPPLQGMLFPQTAEAKAGLRKERKYCYLSHSPAILAEELQKS
jgi:hypothetical protein